MVVLLKHLSSLRGEICKGYEIAFGSKKQVTHRQEAGKNYEKMKDNPILFRIFAALFGI
ncbi:MAG: hypothetical protein J5616_02690 [Bacteroidaceae bacterium]|nr:hypothetical protein [Bacteroidaceae bacterium]